METPGFGIPPRLARSMSMAEQHEYLRRALSRRRVVTGAGGLAGGLLLAGCSESGGPGRTDDSSADSVSPAPTGAAAFGRHLAFGADPRSQMRVGWQLPLPVRRPYVRFGTEDGDLGGRVEAEIRPLKTPALSGLPALEQHYVHASLDGLAPGTAYVYGLGHDGFDPASRDAAGHLATFRTAPAGPRRFVFTAFGDQGTGSAARATTRGIRDLPGGPPAFHLHAGDICYAEDSGRGLESDHYDARVWDRFMRQIDPVSSRVPWMPAMGNHDMEAWYSPDGYGGQRARWTLPGNGFDPREAPGVYSFVYGNVAVVALDANDVSYEIPANLGYTDGAQARWLDRRLGELRGAQGVDFVVVFFHHCAYSTSTHASDGGVRGHFTPLFDKHRVDLVINGHNHVYERTDALRAGALTRPLPIGGSADPERDGAVYVTAGGGGRKLYDFTAPDSYEGRRRDRDVVHTFAWTRDGEKAPEDVEWSRVRYTGYSFLAVESRPGTSPALRVAAYAEDGRRIDRFELVRGR
ncbi:purple acid phosphatase family protein [Streptomyces sp. CMB-StM0423]|uniref:purple acid phosphatase family protein n=1 Tax=Streptomyces sp. CMB-StM0423 TaxID=2059884 RepID=UPI000C71272E|nr:metallophosphoesterase family protein [Streptomyces sp. CMB-StM0423]AUH40299.1 phosphoesterase [Streptomyces sp. CMB-StM0423]